MRTYVSFEYKIKDPNALVPDRCLGFAATVMAKAEAHIWEGGYTSPETATNKAWRAITHAYRELPVRSLLQVFDYGSIYPKYETR